MKPVCNSFAALFIVMATLMAMLMTGDSIASAQQQPAQPPAQAPPFTVPNPRTPAAPDAAHQQTAPAENQPQVAPDAPLPRTDKTTIDLRSLPALAAQPHAGVQPSGTIQSTEDSGAKPSAEAPSAFHIGWFSGIAAYRAPRVPALQLANQASFEPLVHDGKLYLSLHDAITLAIANNLDVEIERYNLLLADTDLTRARGGGTLRGIDYTVQQTPAGVGSLTSPLLVTSATGGNAPANVNVTDLSQITQSGSGIQQTLAENGTQTFAQGPPIPLYDPILQGEAGYFRRSDQTSLLTTASTSGAGSSSDDSTTTGALDYVSTGLDYQQGFSTGAQLEAFTDNASQVLYASTSQYNPFHSPSFSATLSQPLLRGLGPSVNLRFTRIARINQKVSRLLFEQQLLETIYGISRLYFDLVSLGENVGVKEEALAAAQKLYDDDNSQVEEGTLAPIELTRARALLSSSRLDLIQAQGEYRQQEVILKEQLVRKLGESNLYFATIIPTDHIVIPDESPSLDVTALTEDALANRPDLAQAALQVKTDVIAFHAARNAVKPQLNAYANVQTRGSSLVAIETLGTAGTGQATLPAELTQGGLRLSTIYQGGVQLNLPLRNRIAQADAARDAIQARQAEGRTAKLENDIRQQIENAAIALENAHQSYAAAVESSNYQQQLLQAEIDKFAVGESTNYLIIQDQSYLAQARSTEVAARSDWMKAQLALDRALGDLLEKQNILWDDAVSGRVP
jgi:outer membrane protein TolC